MTFAWLGVVAPGQLGCSGDDSSPRNAAKLPRRQPWKLRPDRDGSRGPRRESRVTLISVGASTVTATAYDASSRAIATISVKHPGTGVGLGAHDPITLTGAGIVRVVFAITTPYSGDGFRVDDISF